MKNRGLDERDKIKMIIGRDFRREDVF